MDEPLSNLDAKLRVDLRAEIVELQRRLGATVIYVTHDQGEAMTMSHRVAVMDGGRIRQIGAPLELYENPVDRFVAEFIGSPKINVVAATRQPDGSFRAFGATFACPPGPVFAALKPGPLGLALRPEALTLADRQNGAAPFAGTVRLVEHLGSEALVIVGMAGATERLTVRVPAGEARGLAPGAAVALRPDWSRALLFDERGRRMAAAPSRSAAA
jgi:multiple sugar transport system ATP-binding protein